MAGFDAGDGKHRFEISGSCTDFIINITSESNCNRPGVFIFEIDDFQVFSTTKPQPTTTRPATKSPETVKAESHTPGKGAGSTTQSSHQQGANQSNAEGTACGCNLTNLWLDLLLLIDVSVGVQTRGLEAVSSF